MNPETATPPSDDAFRTGFVAIVGRPNVGKSTLLNRLIGQKISIVSRKAQTTRHRVTGVLTEQRAQFIFVDTPGFYPGKDLEWRGMIRKGAQLAFAYARATVPRLAVVVRKSYGGAYIVMDSKRMGNDLMFAWPTAEIAVMGARQASEILHRRETPERRAELEADYEERLLNPYVAAERGTVDAVIEPAETRAALAAGLEVLESKRERLVGRRHDNPPL